MKSDSRIPLYKSIQEYIKEQVASGKLKAQDRIPSEMELMKQFGVSRITVSNALTEMAKEGYINRIPGRGSFIGDNFNMLMNGSEIAEGENEKFERSFQGRDDSSSGIIGFIIQNILDYFSLTLLKGISDMAREKGYSLIVKCSLNKDLEDDAIRELLNLGVDGLIIFPVDQETYSDEILALKVNHFPLVLIDRYLSGVETNYVVSDNFTGAKLAVSHLYDLGHRNIAMCSSTLLPTSSTEDRVSGYMDELKQRGEMINPGLIISNVKTDIVNFQQNDQLLSALLNREATAYITTESKMSMYIYQLCLMNKIRVPEDVSIVSFDDPSPEFGEYGFFTHVSQSEYEMGCEAARILAEILQSGQNSSENGYKKIILNPKLITRKSTGPIKVK